MLNNNTLFDGESRVAALDIKKSFIVQAPAGSGKTELLVQRILSLLCWVKKPEEILAITFTRKAANEMRTRVINALKLSLLEMPKAPHAARTWQLAKQVMQRDAAQAWGLLQNPNQLNIQTIDSLCSYLTNQLPILSQFGAPPRITSQANVIYGKAIDDMLERIDDHPDLQHVIAIILTQLDNDLLKLKSLLITLLTKRDQWIPYLQYTTDSQHAKEQLEYYLRLLITEKLHNLANLFPKNILQEVSLLAFHGANNLKLLDKQNSLTEYCHSSSIPTATLTDLDKWLALANFMLTKEGEYRKKASIDQGFLPKTHFKNKIEAAEHDALKKQYLALLSALSQHELLRKSLHALFSLPRPAYSKEQWDSLYALLTILKVLLAQLRVSFQEHGQIDFIENTQAALRALGDEDAPTNLTLALDYQFQHILIDEFQDTSITQFQLLEKLIAGWGPHDGKTLFIVGDPMQSIYRFRDAEVGLFIKIWQQGIKNKPLERLSLSVNFRSTKQIIDWNNQHFSQLFPSVDLVSEGAVSFSASTAIHPDIEETYVKVIACEQADDSQAALIASTIQALKKSHPLDTVAILLRSRSHIKKIIPALKNLQLSFQASEIDNLYSKQAIKDLLSLIKAMLDFSDKIAWAAILRAPWCGLTLADLAVLINEQTDIIWYAIINEQRIMQLSHDGQVRLKRFAAILKRQLPERDRMPLLELVESTWMLLGGPACLGVDTTQDDIMFFFDLLDSMQHELSAYTVDQFETLVQRSFSSASEEQCQLLIMTIHAAKGLEFDTVIIPHLEKALPQQDKELLAWLEYPLSNQAMSLLLAPLQSMDNKNNMLHDFIATQQKLKLDYEVDRLLYVAMTRAKKRLLLTFKDPTGTEGKETLRAGSFLHKLWPYIRHEYLALNSHAANASDDHLATKKTLHCFTQDWQNILHASSKHIAMHHQKLGFSLKDETPRLIGTVVHTILQQIAKKGIAWWQRLSERSQSILVCAHLDRLYLSSHMQASAYETIRKHLHNITHDEMGRWILHAHQGALSEYAVSVHQGDNLNLVIDRTFIDEKNIRWIIDYKTTEIQPSELEEHVECYRSQLERYYEAFFALEQREIKLGLYFTAIPAWREVVHCDFEI